MNNASGVINGIGWYELEFTRMLSRTSSWWLPPEYRDLNNFKVIVLCAPNAIWGQDQIDRYQANPSDLSYRLSRSSPCRFLDEQDVFAGKAVIFDRYSLESLDLNKWAAKQIEIPKNIALTIDIDFGKLKALAIATTEQNGRIRRVKREIPADLLLIDGLKPILEEFSRKYPAPKEGPAACSWSQHVDALLGRLTGYGHDLVQDWLSNPHYEPGSKSITPLTVPGRLFANTSIWRAILRRSNDLNSIYATIVLGVDREVKEDESGVTITLPAQVPETMLAGLRGVDVARVVDIQWLAGLTVRTARTVDNKCVIRAAASGLPARLRDRPEDSETDAITWLTDIADKIDNAKPCTCEAVEQSALPILSKLGPAELAAILARLDFYQEVSLSEFGQPGWVIRRQGNTIGLKESPLASLAGLIRDVTTGYQSEEPLLNDHE